MKKILRNRSGEMEVFAEVVERASFSAAARSFGLTPSAISKLVQRLEARLGVQLVRRTTRKLQVTAEGREFYERSLRVLSDLDEVERGVAAGEPARGRVSINSNVPFGQHVLIPLIPRLLETYPQLTLDLSLTDRVIDLLDERVDIAIRWGKLTSSELVARKLGETAQAIVGSPAYLARHGTPRTLRALQSHARLGSNYRRNLAGWPLRAARNITYLPPIGGVYASDGESLRALALAGAGLARLSLFHIQPDLDAGRLVRVLEHLNPRDIEPIHAVYVGKAARLPARVVAVLDFLQTQVGRDERLRTTTARDRATRRSPA